MKFLDWDTRSLLKEAIKITNTFSEKTLRDRRNELEENGSLNGRSDILSRLMEMEMEMEQSECYFSDKFLRDFCISLILAGRDTSSVGLAWFSGWFRKIQRLRRKS